MKLFNHSRTQSTGGQQCEDLAECRVFEDIHVYKPELLIDHRKKCRIITKIGDSDSFEFKYPSEEGTYSLSVSQTRVGSWRIDKTWNGIVDEVKSEEKSEDDDEAEAQRQAIDRKYHE